MYKHQDKISNYKHQIPKPWQIPADRIEKRKTEEEDTYDTPFGSPVHVLGPVSHILKQIQSHISDMSLTKIYKNNDKFKRH